jgi:hypothetical protein
MTITQIPETTTFRESVKNVCPSWLQGFWGYRFLYSTAIQLDAISEALRQGVLARMPGYGTREALPYIGNDRQILRGFQETDAAYIQRLQQAIPTWKLAGNSYSIIGQLAGYVSPYAPTIRYVVTGKDETNTSIADYVTLQAGATSYSRRSGANFNWDWDGQLNNYRFWVILYLLNPGGLFGPVNWGGFSYGDGSTWGGSATAGLVQDVRAIVSKWKAGGTQCVNIIVAPANVTATVFNPTNAPGGNMPDGDWNNFRNRYSGALYWDGVL